MANHHQRVYNAEARAEKRSAEASRYLRNARTARIREAAEYLAAAEAASIGQWDSRANRDISNAQTTLEQAKDICDLQMQQT